MAKTPNSETSNMYVAYNWLNNLIATNDVTAHQQAVLQNVIWALNRNFWSPAQISDNKLANLSGCDKRTLKRVLNVLSASNWLDCDSTGYFIPISFKPAKCRVDSIKGGVVNNGQSSSTNSQYDNGLVSTSSPSVEEVRRRIAEFSLSTAQKR